VQRKARLSVAVKIMEIKDLYARFYWGVMEEFDLSPTEALLMTLVENLSKKGRPCFASKKKLATTLNVSEPTIYNCINRLMEKRLLEKGDVLPTGVMELKILDDLWSEYIIELNKKIEEMKSR
jgi:hypothetical protein